MQLASKKPSLQSLRRPVCGVMAALIGVGLWTAADAQTLERIRGASAIKLGYEVDARPFSFKNEFGHSRRLCGRPLHKSGRSGEKRAWPGELGY